jgi:hypothetical protein
VTDLSLGALIKAHSASLAGALDPVGFKERADALFAAAMAGDTEAAIGLSVLVNNPDRGELVRTAFEARMPVAPFRVMLQSVWDHDHREVWLAADHNIRTFNRWFRYAAFDLSHLSFPLTVWRGVGMNPKEHPAKRIVTAGLGHAWTTDRDVACWFAVRFVCLGAVPSVLRRTIKWRRQLLYWSDERSEAEVIAAGVGPVATDGTPDDWKEGADRYDAARLKHDARE